MEVSIKDLEWSSIRKNVFKFPASVVQLTVAKTTTPYEYKTGIAYDSIGVDTGYTTPTAFDIVLTENQIQWKNNSGGYGLSFFADVEKNTDYDVRCESNSRVDIIGFKRSGETKTYFGEMISQIQPADDRISGNFNSGGYDFVCFKFGTLTRRDSDYFVQNMTVGHYI